MRRTFNCSLWRKGKIFYCWFHCRHRRLKIESLVVFFTHSLFTQWAQNLRQKILYFIHTCNELTLNYVQRLNEIKRIHSVCVLSAQWLNVQCIIFFLVAAKNCLIESKFKDQIVCVTAFCIVCL